MTSTIAVNVSYGQLAVFASSLTSPFNDWTEGHVAQGFAWRPGSVSFKTLVESGAHSVNVQVVDHAPAVQPGSVRVIEVPFDVPASGAIEIGSISETAPLSLDPGRYLLRCEMLHASDKEPERVNLIFSTGDIPHFAIVIADSALLPHGGLLTMAEPAAP